MRKGKTRVCKSGIDSPREIERALVKPTRAGFLATHACPEDRFKHLLFEPANDRIFLEQIKNWRMAFEDLRALFFCRTKLRHVTFAVANFGQPFRTFDDTVSFYFCLQLGGPFLEHAIKKLLRRVCS